MISKLKLVIIAAATIGLSATAFAKRGGDQMHPRRAAMLAKFDVNKDGKLDKSEKTAMRNERIEKRFAKLDANKDGVITLDEMKSAKSKGHKKGHKRGPKAL